MDILHKTLADFTRVGPLDGRRPIRFRDCTLAFRTIDGWNIGTVGPTAIICRDGSTVSFDDVTMFIDLSPLHAVGTGCF